MDNEKWNELLQFTLNVTYRVIARPFGESQYLSHGTTNRSCKLPRGTIPVPCLLLSYPLTLYLYLHFPSQCRKKKLHFHSDLTGCTVSWPGKSLALCAITHRALTLRRAGRNLQTQTRTRTECRTVSDSSYDGDTVFSRQPPSRPGPPVKTNERFSPGLSNPIFSIFHLPFGTTKTRRWGNEKPQIWRTVHRATEYDSFSPSKIVR